MCTFISTNAVRHENCRYLYYFRGLVLGLLTLSCSEDSIQPNPMTGTIFGTITDVTNGLPILRSNDYN